MSTDVTRPVLADLSVGDVIGTRTVEVDRARLVRYAGASGDFNPIHWNDAFAAEVGLPGVIAHGMFTMGAAVALVEEWAGDPGAVVDYQTRFTRPRARAEPRRRDARGHRDRRCDRRRRRHGPRRPHGHLRGRARARQDAGGRPPLIRSRSGLPAGARREVAELLLVRRDHPHHGEDGVGWWALVGLVVGREGDRVHAHDCHTRDGSGRLSPTPASSRR